MIPVEEIGRVPIEDFILPPRGKSEEKDFDLLSHLELEKEKGDDDDEDGEEDQDDGAIEQV